MEEDPRLYLLNITSQSNFAREEEFIKLLINVEAENPPLISFGSCLKWYETIDNKAIYMSARAGLVIFIMYQFYSYLVF
jgi:hypothetical protein